MLFTTALVSLFACTTTSPPKKTLKTRFLKNNISQAELNNALNYKRYHYRCKNSETGSTSYLATYFPLSVESRMKDNFGFYFQLDGGNAIPFDHLANRALNARGSRFEVLINPTTLFMEALLIWWRVNIVPFITKTIKAHERLG